MTRSIVRLFVAALALGLAGCNQQPPKPQTAVVDLDGVAKAVGRMDQITQQLESATRQINLALQEAAAELQAEFNAEQKKVGDNPSDADKKRLAELGARAQQVLANNKAIAQTRHAQVQAQLIQQFRDEIQPLAEKVAKERGYDMIVVTGSNLVWYDPKLDLTGAIIDAYKQNPPKPATPGTPGTPGTPATSGEPDPGKTTPAPTDGEKPKE